MRPHYLGVIMLLCIVTACKKDKAVNTPAGTTGEDYTICAVDNWVDEQGFQSVSGNVHFVYNNKVYVPQGANTDHPGNGIVHVFDGTAWTEKPGANIPLYTMAPTVCFTIGSKGYAGEGVLAGSPCPFYEYNILTNTWTRKADFPGKALFGTACFVVNGKGYVVGGNNFDEYTSENWEYNPANNTWTKRKSLLLNRACASGFSIGSKGYIVNGRYPDDFGLLHGLTEYDPATDKWTNKEPLPGLARTNPAVFVIDGEAYAGGGGGTGGGEGPTDFYRYTQSTDSWARMADMPEGHTYRVSFTLNGKGYAVYSQFTTPSGIPSGMFRYNPRHCTTINNGVPLSGGQ